MLVSQASIALRKVLHVVMSQVTSTLVRTVAYVRKAHASVKIHTRDCDVRNRYATPAAWKVHARKENVSALRVMVALTVASLNLW